MFIVKNQLILTLRRSVHNRLNRNLNFIFRPDCHYTVHTSIPKAFLSLTHIALNLCLKPIGWFRSKLITVSESERYPQLLRPGNLSTNHVFFFHYKCHTLAFSFTFLFQSGLYIFLLLLTGYPDNSFQNIASSFLYHKVNC